jgi:O-antigen/teichoic acid export membrane protein
MKKNNILSDLKKLAIRNQSFWSLGSNGVSALAGLVLFWLSSSRLSSADFGAWVLFQTGSGLMDMFRVGLLLPGYLQLSAGRSRKLKTEIFASVQHAFLVFTILQVILCWALAQKVSSPPWNFFFQNYPWIILSGTIVTLSEWWFQSNIRFQHIFLFRSINRMLLVVSAFLFANDLAVFVYVQTAANLITGIVIITFVRIPNFRNYNYKKHHYRLFHFGKYSTPTQVASNLLRSSDTLMISSVLGAAITGIYGAAAKFIEFVELPIRSLGAVLFNQLAKLANTQRHDEAWRVAKNYVWITTLRILPISIFLYAFAPYLITHISGPNYIESIPILRVMAFYCLLIPADRCLGLLLEAYGRPDLNLLKVTVMLVVNVVGDGIAIYLFHSPWVVALFSLITFIIGITFGIWLVVYKSFPRHQNAKLELAIE